MVSTSGGITTAGEVVNAEEGTTFIPPPWSHKRTALAPPPFS